MEFLILQTFFVNYKNFRKTFSVNSVYSLSVKILKCFNLRISSFSAKIKKICVEMRYRTVLGNFGSYEQWNEIFARKVSEKFLFLDLTSATSWLSIRDRRPPSISDICGLWVRGCRRGSSVVWRSASGPVVERPASGSAKARSAEASSEMEWWLGSSTRLKKNRRFSAFKGGQRRPARRLNEDWDLLQG
jgi:hypothetical protein